MQKLLPPGIIMLILFTTSIHAQTLSRSVITGAGGFFQNDGSLSWTLAEPVTETFQQDSVILTQGFQQSAIEVATLAQNYTKAEVHFTAYPNPVKQKVRIAAKGIENGSIRLELYSMNGALLWNKQAVGKNFPVEINLTGYQPGVYVLHALHARYSHSFKIIKK